MWIRWLPVVTVVLAAWAAGADAQQPGHGRLFPPEELGILESPDRDEWQQPDRIKIGRAHV